MEESFPLLASGDHPQSLVVATSSVFKGSIERQISLTSASVIVSPLTDFVSLF